VQTTQRQVSQSFKTMERDASSTGLTLQRAFSAPLASIQEQLLGGASGMAKFAGAAVGITAAVGLGAVGMKNFVKEVSDTALEIRSLSQSTGLSIAAADKLRAAANLTGFDIRNLKEAALDLSQALLDTSGTNNSRELLRQLGVSAFTASGQARQLGEVLEETFEALSKIDDTTKRVNLSRVLGGEDAAKNVQPFLVGYREANRLAAELGFGTRDGVLAALGSANTELRKFDLQWEVTKGKLAQGATVPIQFLPSFAGQFLTGFSPFTAGAETRTAAESIQFAGATGGTTARPGVIPASEIAQIDALGLRAAGQRLAEQFRTAQGNSPDGIQFRLATVEKERADLRVKLSSGDLAPAAFNDSIRSLDRLTKEKAALEKRLKDLQNPPKDQRVERLLGLDARLRAIAAAPVGAAPATFSSLISEAGTAGGTFFASTAAIAEANPDTGLFQQRAALESQQDQDARRRNLDFIRQELQFQERKVELLTGPGGELAAINAIADLKRSALEQELQAGAEITNLRERQLEIEEERTLRILELQRQRRFEARALASDLDGSLQSGNPGGFFRQEGGRLINQIGTNALEGTFTRLQGTFGSIGANSGLGGLLKGTLFDPANANTPVDRNTVATEANTAALERLNSGGVPGVTGIPGGGGLPGLVGVFGSDTNGLTGTGPLQAGRLAQFGAGVAAIPQVGLFGGLSAADRSVQLSPGVATTTSALGLNSSSSRAGNVVGSAAVLGAATFGAIDGFRRGGAAGNLQGISSVLGAASLIPGPQQPFVAAGALIAGFVAAALPDPKLKRDRQIDELLNSSIYSEPVSTAYNIDAAGRGYDMNKRGDYRSMGATVIVNTMDAKSFIDNRESIADAVRVAMLEGHGVNRAAQEVVLGR
jgi:hypothetical protein